MQMNHDEDLGKYTPSPSCSIFQSAMMEICCGYDPRRPCREKVSKSQSHNPRGPKATPSRDERNKIFVTDAAVEAGSTKIFLKTSRSHQWHRDTVPPSHSRWLDADTLTKRGRAARDGAARWVVMSAERCMAPLSCDRLHRRRLTFWFPRRRNRRLTGNSLLANQPHQRIKACYQTVARYYLPHTRVVASIQSHLLRLTDISTLMDRPTTDESLLPHVE